MTRPVTLFLLSPASCAGKRAQLLFRDAAAFPLAVQLRSGGASLAEVFTFLSGLYFRGKMAYAQAFARPPRGAPGVFIITSSRGLVLPEAQVVLDDLREFAAVPIDVGCARYRDALARTSQELAERVGQRARIVLLGSVATDKYVAPLRSTFGNRLRFPPAFIGRGDMSRGGLMLRCAEDGVELDYVRLDGATRHGPRPARLAPRPRSDGSRLRPPNGGG